jgi:hypothetical protein
MDCPGIESLWWRDSSHLYRPALGPPSLLYNGYRVFPGGKKRPGRDVDLSPHCSADVWKQGRAIPLLFLRAFVACKKGETYLCTEREEDTKLLSQGTALNTINHIVLCSKIHIFSHTNDIPCYYYYCYYYYYYKHHRVNILQGNTGWSKVSVHLLITVQKISKNILNTIVDLKLAITGYIRNADRAILNTVFENTVRRVNKCLETDGGQFEHYW